MSKKKKYVLSYTKTTDGEAVYITADSDYFAENDLFFITGYNGSEFADMKYIGNYVKFNFSFNGNDNVVLYTWNNMKPVLSPITITK